MLDKIITQLFYLLLTKGHWFFIIVGSYMMYGLVGGFLLINDFEIIDCKITNYSNLIKKKDQYKTSPKVQYLKVYYEYEFNGKSYNGSSRIDPKKGLPNHNLKSNKFSKLYISSFNHRFNSITKPSDKIELSDLILFGFYSVIIFLGLFPLFYQFGILKPKDENDIMNMYVKREEE